GARSRGRDLSGGASAPPSLRDRVVLHGHRHNVVADGTYPVGIEIFVLGCVELPLEDARRSLEARDPRARDIDIVGYFVHCFEVCHRGLDHFFFTRTGFGITWNTELIFCASGSLRGRDGGTPVW